MGTENIKNHHEINNDKDNGHDSHKHNHHKHNHYHPDTGKLSTSRLLIAVSLNFLITTGEIIGGVLSGSLALLSDALHNFTDAIALIISYTASKISRKENTLERTFGYRRIEILAALINALFLVTVSVFLIKEGIERILKPVQINGFIVITVALVGLCANTISVLILHKDSKHNLNVKSAYIHLLGDALSSLAVVVGGIIMHFFRIYWIDAVLTILIALFIIKSAISIVVEASGILMHKVPDGLNILEIENKIMELPHIDGIHHVHIWQLNEIDVFFESHVDLKSDCLISETADIRKQIESILKEFGISHVTLQLEFGCCEDRNLISKENHSTFHK
ncbi:cation diffusion facilitator family transporter [Myxococcota bacterium]|nr:cation diffusion facilitator family transporter [Myxococcota bacterium]MBU1380048.1 cation diffusion facilitator family transporter [Myxococcota bacterium]MBU1495506.1 cation diffusion facilitator family transporter [Myxococcota bacterium]